ncbi:MAG TPA: aminotransferase class I/II-fold pyridoxal phosphate-dependent enzyme, partial [Puia sp.]|nr:aminotransferase class I/II-fold pyridoxal phosphate-dependent enzyme [Puia sp.]
RPFIYTTALPESSVAAIYEAYQIFPALHDERNHLKELIAQFQHASINFEKLKSETPIQVVIVPGNEAVKKIANRLQENNFDVRPIVYPTVPKGSERLRIVVHSFNTIDELKDLVDLLKG